MNKNKWSLSPEERIKKLSKKEMSMELLRLWQLEDSSRERACCVSASNYVVCPVCKGAGEIIKSYRQDYHTGANYTLPCHGCQGKGWIQETHMKRPY